MTMMPCHFGVITEPRYASGGLAHAAQRVNAAGRNGDSVVVHLSPEEFGWLRQNWGEPTRNPKTGLPEYFKLGSFFKQAAPFIPVLASVFAPGIGTAIGSALGAGSTFAPVLGNALIGAGAGALGGGGKGALIGGLTGAATSALAPVVANALSGTEFGNALGIENTVRPTVFDGLNLSGATPSGSAAVGSGAAGAVGGGAQAPSASEMAQETARKAAAAGISIGGAGAPSPSPLAEVGASAPAVSSEVAKPESLLSKYKWPLLGGGALLLASQAFGQKKPQQPAIPASYQANTFKPTNYSVSSRPIPAGNTDWYRYGMRPQTDAASPQFMDRTWTSSVQAAHGGYMGAGSPLATMAGGGQGPVAGPGTGRSDEIPARLSDGEYVIDAETVAMLGDGSSDAGARALDRFRANIRSHKGRALSQGRISPDAKPPEQYLGRRR